MRVTGMLIYSVLTILHYYFIIILYYDNIILSYYYIILAQYIIYWHFFQSGFLLQNGSISMILNYWGLFQAQNFGARLFHVQKNTDFNNFFCFVWAHGPWGPGPWSPLGPMGPPFARFVDPIFEICWLFAKWSGTYLEVFLWCLGVQGTP